MFISLGTFIEAAGGATKGQIKLECILQFHAGVENAQYLVLEYLEYSSTIYSK